ncbi:PREDICTED: mitogen-activated protein kinase 15, partial [Chaetura pelagica]|uniref:mitogen-activated protein kinase 15 n=1 Tax=Chaetura pelagica TaxID=8897 RepID=UPI000523E212
RTFREVVFLQEFGAHPNIIKLLDVIPAENDKDIYLIFESMETDLHAVIQKGGLLKDIHKSYILYQLLKATKFIHSGNVIHRDQKPSNVLLDAECCVKLCDFGLARSLAQLGQDQEDPALTDYVATRWYRAPEILLSSPRYTKGVDMWSLGCILGELLLGKPLFPGTSTVNQLEQILRVIPAPSPEGILGWESQAGTFSPCVLARRRRVTLEELLPPSAPPPALDLLKKLLVFDPGKRLSAEEALEHPYVRRFHCPAQEPSLGHEVVLPLGDDVQLPVAQYRNQLYQMILDRKSRDRPKEQVQRENVPLGQPEPPPAPRKGPRETTPPVPKPSQVPAGTSTSAQPGAAKQEEDLARTFCQRAKINVVYNPITHTAAQRDAHPGAVTRTCSAPLHQQAGIPNSRKVGTQIPWGNPRLPPWDGQNLCNNPRNPQIPSKDVRPLPKSSKKMFQITANVGAAGDPKASLGSYSQAYGTICQSALQSLPIPRPSQHQ